MNRVTNYYRFDDEAAAIAALPQFRLSDDDGDVWDTSCIDADVPVISAPAVLDDEGNVVTPAVREGGYFLNLLLQERDEALEAVAGFVGAIEMERWTLIAGAHPVTPQRVFA